ncbi:hypothetical protein [Bathymodiolus platifrons methanotrophic gill symbiont]|uniref:hypothetical protein n=1 Tax=Bathymodiolus platifrons methanotrophic gill symbiont TaxID=113268 RepID=UPI001C8DFD27|nr:hypothetical protein [Bathymodiolus platifrons methanotrophic gill symbiont]
MKQSSQLVPVKLVTEDTLIGSRLSAGLSVIKRTHSNGFIAWKSLPIRSFHL